MFTSRAEYRLSLRADNADLRLTPEAMRLGCVSAERSSRFRRWTADLDAGRDMLKTLTLTPTEGLKQGLKLNLDGQRRSAFELLSYADHSVQSLASVWPQLAALPAKLAEALEIDATYAVYMNRQAADIVAVQREENRYIPDDFDFQTLSGLSNELKQKLDKARPRNLAQAMKIDGITPSAISLILAHLAKSEQSSTTEKRAMQ